MRTKHVYISRLAGIAGQFLGSLGKRACEAFLADDPSVKVMITISQGDNHIVLHHDEAIEDFASNAAPVATLSELRSRAKTHGYLARSATNGTARSLEDAGGETPPEKKTKKKVAKKAKKA